MIWVITLLFVVSCAAPAFAKKPQTLGEAWKEKKFKEIDDRAARQKEDATFRAGDNAWRGGAAAADREHKKIDKDVEKQKKEVEETYKKLGPAKNKPYNPKKKG